MEIGTDTKKFKLIAEIQVWVNKDGTMWDLWIGNMVFHLESHKEVIEYGFHPGRISKITPKNKCNTIPQA